MTTNRKRNLRRASSLATLLALTAVACGGGGGNSAGDAAGGGAADVREATVEPAEVVMRLIAFGPERLDVAAGTTVTWRNRDAGPHTVVAGTVVQGGAGVTQEPAGTFASGQLAKGDSFEHAFEEPGTYPYFCSLHPATMRGEVRVT